MPALMYIIDNGDQITRDKFLRMVDFGEDENETIPKWDYHIQYEHLGNDIYWFIHSAIEHVYATEESIQQLNRRAIEEGY